MYNIVMKHWAASSPWWTAKWFPQLYHSSFILSISFPSHPFSLFLPFNPSVIDKVGGCFSSFSHCISISKLRYTQLKKGRGGEKFLICFFCQSLSSKISAISSLDYTYRILGVLILLTRCFKGASLLGK